MPSISPPRAGRLWIGLIVVLLSVHAALGIHTAVQLSVTHDEYWHLPIGLLNWKTGRFDQDPLNPPLMRLWAAWPLWLMGIDRGDVAGVSSPGGYGEAFLRANLKRYHQLFAIGRSLNVLVSVATGVLLAWWGRALFGKKAACLAVLLWTCCPNVIAHAAVVTSDVGAAFFFVATLFALWRWARNPSWSAAVIFGAVLGLAQLAKFTCILLLPLSLVVWIVMRTNFRRRGTGVTPETASPNPNPPRAAALVLVAQWLAALALGLLVLNAGYLFRGTGASLQSYQFQSPELQWLNGGPDWPLPLPRDFLVGFDQQRAIMRQPHPVFLDREWSTEGFPSYYLKTLLYKLPHPTQCLIAIALLASLLPRRMRRDRRRNFDVLLPPAVLLAVASLNGMQLGIRYVLPALPFLFLYASQVGEWLDWRQAKVRTLLLGLVIAAVPLSLRYHPHHLAYFNEFAGGPFGGREHLLDSNLDWGQDLRALADYVRERQLGEIGLAYFGTVPPDALGIAYHLPTPRRPPVGTFAISVNLAQGRPYAVRGPDGERVPIALFEYGYFRLFEPTAHIGYSIDVYEITPEDLERVKQRVRGHD